MEHKVIKHIAQYEATAILQELPEWTLYRAADTESGKNVLIKTWYPNLRWSEEGLNEFFNTLSMLRLLENPYLLPILDFGKIGKAPYVVFPDLQAVTLQDFFAAPSVTSSQFLVLFAKIAEALEFLHKQETLHGMLSPENILVDAEASPHLMDYGLHDVLKKVLLENMPAEYQNLSIARIRYASPEQVLGRNPTPRSDVYSFGLIFYFCANGENFATGNTAPEMAISHLRPEEKWSARKFRNLSAGTLKFLHRCQRIDPEYRFQDFSEVVRLLRHLATSSRSHVTVLPRTPTHPAHKRKIPAWIPAGAALLLLLGLIALGWRLLRPETTAPAAASPTPSSLSVLSSPTLPAPTARSQSTQEALLPTDTPSAATSLPSNPPSHLPSLEGQSISAPVEEISLASLPRIQETSRLGFGMPEDVDISSSQGAFAVVSSAGVFIFDSTGNSLITWIDPQGWATSVQFSPDGSLLAVGMMSGEIQLWNWMAGIRTDSIAEHSARVTRILFSINGRFLYSTSEDQRIVVRDLQLKKSHSFAAHSDSINDISVSADGRTVASCSDDGHVRLWDHSSEAKLFDPPFDGKCQAVALSSDGAFLAAGGDTGYLYQWNVAQQQRRTDIVPLRARIWAIRYIENDSKIFVGMEGGKTTILVASQEKYTFFGGSVPDIDPRLKDALGSDFLFHETFASYGSGTNHISAMWDGILKNRLKTVWGNYYDHLDRLALSQDGSYVAANGRRGLLAVWSTLGGQPLYRQAGGTRLPAGDPVAPNGSAIAILLLPTSLTADQKVQYPNGMYILVKLPSGSLIQLSGLIADGVLSYARQGSLLVAGNPNQSRVWDFGSGYEVDFNTTRESNCWVTLSANDGEILQVHTPVGAFPVLDDLVKKICSKSYPDKVLFAVSGLHDFVVYTNPPNRDGTPMEGFYPQTSQTWKKTMLVTNVTAIGVPPDGSFVVVGTDSGKLLFLDSKTGDLLSQELSGNFGSVTAIKFSGNGKWMATTGTDGVVRLFSIRSNP